MNLKRIGVLIISVFVMLSMVHAVSAADSIEDSTVSVDSKKPVDPYNPDGPTTYAGPEGSRKHHHHKAKFYTGRNHYHEGEDAKLYLKNKDHAPIYVPCDGTIILRRGSTGVISEISWDLTGEGCDAGYGDGTYELEPGDKISQIWDQTDDNGDIVDRGTYKAYTDYYDDDDRHVMVKTSSFKLRT